MHWDGKSTFDGYQLTPAVTDDECTRHAQYLRDGAAYPSFEAVVKLFCGS
jgi:hypothetical protein